MADLDVGGVRGLTEIGRTRSGVVTYRGTDTLWDEPVLVKLLPADTMPALARVAGQRLAAVELLRHPNVVSVLRHGVTSDGRPFVVTADPGAVRSLEASDHGVLDGSAVLAHGIALAGALETAHREGAVHGGVSPAAVLVDPAGNPLLTDWIFLGALIAGSITGQPDDYACLAPEQLAGEDLTPASDVYGLAAVLHYLVAGEHAFARPADPVVAVLSRIGTAQPPDLTAIGVPEPVAAAIARGMAKSPADRFGSAKQFGRALQAAQAALGLALTEMVVGRRFEATGEVAPVPVTPPPSPPPLPPPAAVHEDVQFTVYRPSRVKAARWYPLLAFAHRGGLVEDDDGNLVDPLQAVERQARAVLSDQEVPFDSVRSDATQSVSIGSDLVLEPWLEQGEFNPARATVQWVEHVHRVEFRMRVPAAADGQRVAGGLRVFVGPVLIGELTFRIAVGGEAPARAAPAFAAAAAPAPTPPDSVQGSVREAVRPFRQIFASYSHLDTEVVQAVARYVGVTGDRYFVDVQNLRSGERWERRLEELIEAADVFQLFWSRNAMRSRFVRQELEYALALRREYFVRPVYWEEPLPTDEAQGLPPAEVLALHFSRIGVPVPAPPPVPTPVEAPTPMPAQAATSRPPQAAKAKPTRQLRPGELMCRECGEGNAATRRFCSRCGNSLATADAGRPPPEPGMAGAPSRAATAKRSLTPVVVVIAIVVLVVLAVLAL